MMKRWIPVACTTSLLFSATATAEEAEAASSTPPTAEEAEVASSAPPPRTEPSLIPHLAVSVGGLADATRGSADVASGSVRGGVETGFDAEVPVEALHPGAPFVMPVFGGGASLDAELVGSHCDGCEAARAIDAIGSAEARAYLGWLNGHYRETYQRPVLFGDTYWRDETGTIRRTIGLETDGLAFEYRRGTWDGDLQMFPIAWSRRELFQTELSSYFTPELRLGDENQWSVAIARGVAYQDEMATRFRMVDVSVSHFVVPTARDAHDTEVLPLYETPSSGAIQAFDLDVTLLDLQWSRTSPGLNRLKLGWSNTRPAALKGFADQENWSGFIDYAIGVGQASSEGYVPGWEDAFGQRKPRRNRLGWLIQLEDFHRIDPTGLAVDAGNQLRGDVAFSPISGLTLSAGANLVAARRRVVSPLLAPDATLMADVGDWILMGRAQTQLDWAIHPMVAVVATSWVERSDRADTSRRADVARGVIPLDTSYGMWVGLSLQPL